MLIPKEDAREAPAKRAVFRFFAKTRVWPPACEKRGCFFLAPSNLVLFFLVCKGVMFLFWGERGQKPKNGGKGSQMFVTCRATKVADVPGFGRPRVVLFWAWCVCVCVSFILGGTVLE